MHRAEIKAKLAIAGYKQVDLATELGLGQNTVSAVINGRGRSKRVEDRVSEILGVSAVELWPQWYGEPTLVLSDDERALVLAYRDLSARDRREVLERLQAGVTGDGGTHVHAAHGSHAAGGNITIGGREHGKK